MRRPGRYARSGFGIIDLLAVLPTYLALLVPGLNALVDVRVLRLLRIFRVLKLAEYVAEFGALRQALAAARRKILVFLSFVLLVVLVMGTLMYVVEGPENGYTSIPVGVYWAITTMTTVGFGDITPQDRPGPRDRVGDDAARLGHAGRADRHRQRRVHRPAHAPRDHHPHLPRMPERGTPAEREVLPRLRGQAASVPDRRLRQVGIGRCP